MKKGFIWSMQTLKPFDGDMNYGRDPQRFDDGQNNSGTPPFNSFLHAKFKFQNRAFSLQVCSVPYTEMMLCVENKIWVGSASSKKVPKCATNFPSWKGMIDKGQIKIWDTYDDF